MKSIRKHKASMKQLTKKIWHTMSAETHMIVIAGDSQQVLAV